ncbi:DUF2235 domain-containing protein [Oleiagrimonas sp. C23AA]|nr:DUF2235 domain-containing protein [Oleiagrimonas sp. C23AA]
MPEKSTLTPVLVFSYAYHAISIDEKRTKFPVSLWNEKSVLPGQEIQQVWFAGVHCDVGGGYGDHSLANIPFHWMVNHAKEKGLRFRSGYLEKWVGKFDGYT